uniref:Endonuclease/exonuclease/phosphatase domain-containing protein n=1 Tax=Sinocyclocheilus rhinocerous TaxID=307959 RepID=A0A673IE80_9TELE
MNIPLNVMLWNVRGLNSPIKRTECLEFLKRKNISIDLIQETHLKTSDIHRFQNSSASNKSEGVAILFDRKLGVTIDKCGKDSEGRFSYVAVTFHNVKICFGSIYCPNIPDPNFFNATSDTLLDMPEYLMVVGGDFNQVCNITLDRSANISSGLDTPSRINTFITELNIIDAWRLRYPLVKNYTFFSCRHKTFSRIDYIFVSPQLNKLITSVDILPIIISDHAPVLYTFELTRNPAKRAHRWRFNTTLLQNSEFLKQLKVNLRTFLEINRESVSSPQILWETTKCFIRGEAIAFASYMKASRNYRISQLEKEIQVLESDQKRQFSEQKLNQLITSVDILPIIISDHAPVLYTFELTRNPAKRAHRWRFNTTLLQNSEFLKQLTVNLRTFLEINRESVSSPQILWETTKCFIRGEAIAFASYMKASRNYRISQLEKEIQVLESDQKRQFSEQKQESFLALKFELNNLLKSKAEFSIHVQE